MMTRREVFDTVKAHLLKQNGRCLSLNGDCRYYDPHSGRRCAVGALISDEHYDSRFEGHSCDNSKVRAALEASGVPVHTDDEMIGMLLHLQDIHDDGTVSTWPERLDKLERKYFG